VAEIFERTEQAIWALFAIADENIARCGWIPEAAPNPDKPMLLDMNLSNAQNDLLTFAIWENCYPELPSTHNSDHMQSNFSCPSSSCSSEKFASTLRKNRHSTFKHVAYSKSYFIILCSCFKNVSLHLLESIINSPGYQSL